MDVCHNLRSSIRMVVKLTVSPCLCQATAAKHTHFMILSPATHGLPRPAAAPPAGSTAPLRQSCQNTYRMAGPLSVLSRVSMLSKPDQMGLVDCTVPHSRRQSTPSSTNAGAKCRNCRRSMPHWETDLRQAHWCSGGGHGTSNVKQPDLHCACHLSVLL